MDVFLCALLPYSLWHFACEPALNWYLMVLYLQGYMIACFCGATHIESRSIDGFCCIGTESQSADYELLVLGNRFVVFSMCRNGLAWQTD